MTHTAPEPESPDYTNLGHPLDDETLKKHQESGRRYPNLHLSPGEYVMRSVKRHIIGLLAIWSIVVIAGLLTFAFLPLYAVSRESLAGLFGQPADILPSAAWLAIPMMLITLLFVLGAIIATIVFNGNRFYLTNESVIQNIRTSLFSTNEQTINLRNIEDASYRQDGILQLLLNYGTIRIATVGDESAYRLTYVVNPKEEIRQVVDAIERAVAVSRVRNKPVGTLHHQ